MIQFGLWVVLAPAIYIDTLCSSIIGYRLVSFFFYSNAITIFSTITLRFLIPFSFSFFSLCFGV